MNVCMLTYKNMKKLTRAEIASKAGKASMAKLTSKQRTAKARKGANALWAKIRAGELSTV